MPSIVRGFEHVGYDTPLRSIGNAYLMSKSVYPMSDAEYFYARQYAKRKLDADTTTVFPTEEDRYVYFGRLIGEEACLKRVSESFLGMLSNVVGHAVEIKREPDKTVRPFSQSYSTAFVPQKQ